MKTRNPNFEMDLQRMIRTPAPTGQFRKWLMAVAGLTLGLAFAWPVFGALEEPKEAGDAGAAAVPAPKETAASPAGTEGAAAAGKTKKGVPLSFSGDLREILPLMAKQANLNLILPEDVKGMVTVRLVDMDIKQAMEAILQSKGYSLVDQNGIYLVRSKDTISQEPTKTEIYQFRYASAKEVKPTADKLLSKASGANVQLDERSNTLVITDVPSNIKSIREILKSLDAETPQVLIETKLMEMTRNPQEAIGVNWASLAGYQVTLASPTAAYAGSGTSHSSSGRLAFGVTRSGDAGAIGAANAGRRGGVVMPVGAAGYPFAVVLDAPAFSTTLSFLLQDSDTELLGSPKVITADNREANIKIATQEPIPNFTFNQQTASFVISGFEYKDVGNLLKVTPHVSNVNGEKFITLDVEPQVSTAAQAGRSFALPGGAVTVPLISVRTLTSRVMVKDGNTLALGGLLSAQSTRTYSKVPFFGDIPLFGELFRSRSYNKTKQNLLIFITPTVIASDGGTGLEDQYAQLKDSDENDRFAYRKSLIGNAKPRDQFRKGQEPTGLPVIHPRSNANFDEKSQALDEVSKDLEKTPQVDPGQLTPRLAPSLRE